MACQWPQQGWYLKPYVDLHAIWHRTEAYTESGAGALDLSVDSSSAYVCLKSAVAMQATPALRQK